jgi:hypothetical protein
MDKAHPPESFGVFKPVGHTVMAFRSVVDLEAAATALAQQGFSHAAMVRYTPQEMVQQAEAEQQAAGPLAAFGYELDLVKVHRALAQQGCSFLVVHAPSDELAGRVAAIARAMKAEAAQHYGHFMIEDVVDHMA